MDCCLLCPGIYNCVPPSGPDSDILFIGEAPGHDENKKLIPFIGKTGREVNEHYLPLAGLRRDASYFTNAIKCYPDRPKGKLQLDKQKDRDLLDSCTSFHLYAEIDRIQPKLLVPMGAFACYAINPDISLDIHHGMPIDTRWGIPAFPMWHPAGGIHEPKKMLQIRTDWDRLRKYLAGRLHVPVDDYPDPDYAEVIDSKEINLIDPTLPIACDTESSRRLGPYCLTYSQIPGVARLIRAERADLILKLQAKLDRWESHIIFHNWLYDRGIVMDMGMTFPDSCIRDTMVQAFNLGSLPQGLKVLAFRLLGMTMQDFEDLVKPYSMLLAYDYFVKASTMTWDKPDEQLIKDDKTGRWKLYRPQSFGTKMKRLFTDLRKNPDVDLLDRWENWESHHQEVEAKCGPFEYMDIRHVPFDEALYYACRDAHATLLLKPVLDEMVEKAQAGKLQEQWV